MVGVLEYADFERYRDRLAALPINGVEPSFDAIAAGDYLGARTLYVYVLWRPPQGLPADAWFLLDGFVADPRSLGLLLPAEAERRAVLAEVLALKP